MTHTRPDMPPSSSSWPHWWRVAVVVLCVLMIPAVTAFKLKTHIIIANLSLAELTGSGASGEIDLPGIGPVRVNNPEVVDALKAYPDFYRAGTLGPDAFPDLIGGQLWVHVNKGNKKSERGCPGATGCIDGGVPFEQRRFEKWRAIDNGMYILKRANLYFANPSTPAQRILHLQALAFAYGYLTHMVGDGWAHSYVNEWVRSSFDYFHADTAGLLYGPPTEELQHMAVEGYIDSHMPAVADSNLRIAIPVDFLNMLYTGPAPDSGSALTSSGAFGGVYFERLLEVRAQLAKLADSEQWPLGNGWNARVTAAAINFTNSAFNVATWGTQIGNPVADVEGYFRIRRDVIDVLLRKWVVLSGCVAQNILLGSNRDTAVTTDACASQNFEDSPELRKIFKGELNKAAHHGEDIRKFDFGRLGSNFKKQELVLSKVLERGLSFNPSDDILSLRKIKDQLTLCDQRLVDWESCDETCAAANQICSKLVETAACAGCPRKNGKYSCDGWWRAAQCSADPAPPPLRCFACAGGVVPTGTDPACNLAVSSAAPVCTICSEQPPM